MPKIRLKNYELLSAATSLRVLTQFWLEPGAVSYRFGQVLRALVGNAEDLQKQQDGLIDKFATWEGEGESRKKKVEKLEGGGPNSEFIPMEDGPGYNKARSELMNLVTEVEVPLLLDFELHIKRIDDLKIVRDKLPKDVPTPDMAALVCLVKGSADVVAE